MTSVKILGGVVLICIILALLVGLFMWAASVAIYIAAVLMTWLVVDGAIRITRLFLLHKRKVLAATKPQKLKKNGSDQTGRPLVDLTRFRG